jgi:hypothetical protein
VWRGPAAALAVGRRWSQALASSAATCLHGTPCPTAVRRRLALRVCAPACVRVCVRACVRVVDTAGQVVDLHQQGPRSGRTGALPARNEREGMVRVFRGKGGPPSRWTGALPTPDLRPRPVMFPQPACSACSSAVKCFSPTYRSRSTPRRRLLYPPVW